MADPTRSRILLSLLTAPSYPAELARDLGLTRTNVSNHLACLRGCGFITTETIGRRTRYQINDPHLSRALALLVDVTHAVDTGIHCTSDNCDLEQCCTPAPRGDDREDH